jgi:hypothetical protein
MRSPLDQKTLQIADPNTPPAALTETNAGKFAGTQPTADRFGIDAQMVGYFRDSKQLIARLIHWRLLTAARQNEQIQESVPYALIYHKM